jgi:hypothetical protein
MENCWVNGSPYFHTFYQDNQSAIRFEKKGRKSCGPNSGHINIRYFFIKDRLEIEDFDVVYCPTEQMLTDFFTKPPQGILFRRLRVVVMGHTHVDTLIEFTSATSQERVVEDVSTEKSGAEANAHPTDQPLHGPVISGRTETYAEIVTKRSARADGAESERSKIATNSSHSQEIIPSY